MKKHVAMLAAAAMAASAALAAQQPPRRPASPPGTAAAQIGTGATGKWIEITYGRPLKRGRDLWGSGADYGKKVLLQNNAPVWRAGANVSTRLRTEVPLQVGGKTVAPGEYTLFIDAKSPSDWTLIVSTWAAQEKYDPQNKEALWGSFGYTPDKDVVRVPMTIAKIPMSVDQLTWAFVDMTDKGGKLTLMWDTVVASVPFTVGP
jgi:Protein of unknown function (DUF2911)